MTFPRVNGEPQDATTSWRVRGAAGLALIAIGAVIVTVVSRQGGDPTLFSLTSTHGVDATDLAVLPLLVGAAIVARRGGLSLRQPWATTRRAGAAAAIALGAVLLVTTGPRLFANRTLVPAGGGTLGGSVDHVSGETGNPVGMWTYLAVTYDGAMLSLYVDGERVTRWHTSGPIEPSADPLWIGGNEPYGEYFIGTIDEVRIYRRALDASEIRRDMNRPIASADLSTDPSVVAAYGFEAGAGGVVADATRHVNRGVIDGATWIADGRFGGAMHFDGTAVVRVRPSTSLQLDDTMTLSGWVRPTVSQTGWRTVVQRQTDSYFLTAGGGEAPSGAIDGALALALLGTAAAWLALETMWSAGAWLGKGRRQTSWWALGALFAGCLLDAIVAPAPTTFAVAALAIWFAVTATARTELIGSWVLSSAVLAASVFAVVHDYGAVGHLGSHAAGGVRTTALGVALVVIGILRVNCNRSLRRAGTGSPPDTAIARTCP